MRRNWGAVWIVAALAAVAVLVGTSNGLTVSTDSFVYVTSAESIRDGRGYTIDGDAVIAWPVGYPLLLALGGWLVDVFTFARALNVVGIALAVWLAAVAADRLRNEGGRGVWSSALVGSSIALYLSATALLSEVVFTVLALVAAALLAVDRWTWRRTVALGLTLGALCMVRWAGLSIVAGAVLAMWFTPGPQIERLKRAVVVGSLGAAPLTIGALRNRAAAGTPFGDRGPGDVSVLELGDQFITAAGAAVIRHAEPLHFIAGLAVTALAAVVVVRCFGSTDPHRRIALVAVVYLGFVTASRYRTLFDDLNTRLLLPGLVLLAVAGVGMPGWSKVRTVVLSVLVLVGVVVSGRAMVAGVTDGPQDRDDLFRRGAQQEAAADGRFAGS